MRYRIKRDALINLLSLEVKREIYSQMNLEYKKGDVRSELMQREDITYTDHDVDVIARTVIDDMDCTIPYWDFVDGCIEQYFYYKRIDEKNRRASA